MKPSSRSACLWQNTIDWPGWNVSMCLHRALRCGETFLPQCLCKYMYVDGKHGGWLFAWRSSAASPNFMPQFGQVCFLGISAFVYSMGCTCIYWLHLSICVRWGACGRGLLEIARAGGILGNSQLWTLALQQSCQGSITAPRGIGRDSVP